MKRRRVLAALGCGAVAWNWRSAWAALPAAAPAPAPDGTALTWGADGVVAGLAGGATTLLSDARTAAPAPVPTGRGLWWTTADGTLRCDRLDRDGTWQPLAAHALPSPAHALAASPDGRWVLAAHGEQLSLVDADGRLARRYEGRDLAGRARSAASALFALARRRSFVAAWSDLGELWEISVDPAAPPVFDGLVHDYRMGEAIGSPGFLGVRRAPLGRPLPAIAFADDRVPWVAGTDGDRVAIVHLDVRRTVALLPLPHARPGAGVLRPGADGLAWWLPAGSALVPVDARRWTPLGRVPGPGPAPVTALATAGEALWALAGPADDAALFRLRGDRWMAVDGLGGVPRALCAGADGRLLVLTAGPDAMVGLNADGAVATRWPLAPGRRWDGVAWLA